MSMLTSLWLIFNIVNRCTIKRTDRIKKASFVRKRKQLFLNKKALQPARHERKRIAMLINNLKQSRGQTWLLFLYIDEIKISFKIA